MRHTRRPLALLLALVATVAACDDDVTGPQTPDDVTFDASLGVNLGSMTELDSGVYIQTLTGGQGVPVVDGDLVVVDYTLWLSNGTQRDTGSDVSFRLTAGPGGVIDGFRLGMIGMLKGETRLIVVPSFLGYGAAGTTGIPPHSVLVFRVTLNDLNPPV